MRVNRAERRLIVSIARGRVQSALALFAVVGLVACATSASPSQGDGAAAGTTVNVTLVEWGVAPDTSSVPAGEVIFQITNSGPDDVHEFVVIRTDLAPDALPTDAGRTWSEVVQHRFRSEGDLHGHALGNLLIVALWERLGDTVAGLD